MLMASKMAKRRFIDIGANLTDSMFSGVYHSSSKHEGDLDAVLDRAHRVGVDRLIITSGNVSETRSAFDLIKELNTSCSNIPKLYTTVGVHPTRCQELEDDEKLLEALASLLHHQHVVALGEFGLDYDRLNFCSKEVQLKQFENQLRILLSEDSSRRLPLFLHCRKSSDDLCRILDSFDPSNMKGVVHSFDGTWEEAQRILDLGLHIGINGCSLKTESNLEVLKSIPLSRLLLETDAPWCEIRPSHASHSLLKGELKNLFPVVKKERFKKGSRVKNRNEPCNIIDVFEVVSAVRGDVEPDQLAEAIYENTMKLFFPNE